MIWHPPFAKRDHTVFVILRLSVSGRTDKRISDQRFWHDLYDDWRPLTIARTSGPYCSSLRAPMPGIATSAASSVGNVSAIAISVLSVNTTYAGTLISFEVRSRQSFSWDSSSSSMSDGQLSHRRSMIAGGVVSVLLQTRQRGVAPRGRRGRFGVALPGDCGAMPLRN